MPIVKGTPTVRFNLHDWSWEESPIFLIFHFKGKRLKYSAGEKVRPQFWDTKTQRAKPSRKHPEYTDLNMRLDELKRYVVEIYRRYGNGNLSVEDFRKELDRVYFGVEPKNERAISFFDFIAQFIEERKSQPRGTWKIFLSVSNLLKEYAKDRHRALSYESMDAAFFSDFKNWLYAAPRSHSINYASKVFDVVRQFMKEAKERGYHTTKDFERFSIKKEKTSKIALSFEELETLNNLDLSTNARLAKARDLFLIGAYTGLRFSDFTRIKPERISIENGRKVLSIVTQKTGTPVNIPILEIPEAILGKYDFEVPKLSNQKMNDYLKEIGEMAGLDGSTVITQTTGGKRKEVTIKKFEKLSTHVARRSFATNFYQLGIPAATLMKITGHATERQFMQYIAIDGKENAVRFAEIMESKKSK